MKKILDPVPEQNVVTTCDLGSFPDDAVECPYSVAEPVVNVTSVQFLLMDSSDNDYECIDAKLSYMTSALTSRVWILDYDHYHVCSQCNTQCGTQKAVPLDPNLEGAAYQSTLDIIVEEEVESESTVNAPWGVSLTCTRVQRPTAMNELCDAVLNDTLNEVMNSSVLCVFANLLGVHGLLLQDGEVLMAPFKSTVMLDFQINKGWKKGHAAAGLIIDNYFVSLSIQKQSVMLSYIEDDGSMSWVIASAMSLEYKRRYNLLVDLQDIVEIYVDGMKVIKFALPERNESEYEEFEWGGKGPGRPPFDIGLRSAHTDSTFYSLKITETPYPTCDPTTVPTVNPTEPTASPSSSPTTPTEVPTLSPSKSPTDTPSSSPSISPSDVPSVSPSTTPTDFPSTSPTFSPIDDRCKVLRAGTDENRADVDIAILNIGGSELDRVRMDFQPDENTDPMVDADDALEWCQAVFGEDSYPVSPTSEALYDAMVEICECKDDDTDCYFGLFRPTIDFRSSENDGDCNIWVNQQGEEYPSTTSYFNWDTREDGRVEPICAWIEDENDPMFDRNRKLHCMTYSPFTKGIKVSGCGSLRQVICRFNRETAMCDPDAPFNTNLEG